MTSRENDRGSQAAVRDTAAEACLRGASGRPARTDPKVTYGTTWLTYSRLAGRATCRGNPAGPDLAHVLVMS